jgi:hypothetical protein
MFRRIHAIMNVNRVFFEYTEEDQGIKYWVERISRFLFNNLPFLILFIGLFSSVPSILKIYSPMFKWSGIALITALSLAIGKFMVEENPKIYDLQQEILALINKSVDTLSSVFVNTQK